MLIDTYTNQDIYLKSTTGYDVYGKEILASQDTIKCRFHFKQVRKLDKNGQEFLTDGVVWINPDINIELDDVIIYDNIEYKVKGLDIKVSFTGKKEFKKIFVVKV